MESTGQFLVRHRNSFIKPLFRAAQAVASPASKTPRLRQGYATTSQAQTSSPLESRPDQPTQRILVLGSGWAGYALARSLSRNTLSHTALVSPRSHFVFTPLLASTSVGTLEFRATVEPVRRLGRALDFRQGRAEAVDFTRKVVRVVPCADGEGRTGWLEEEERNGGGSGPAYELPYDRLVVAVGARAQTFGIPGVSEHAHFLRDVGDARAIRQRVLGLFEEAHAILNTDPSSSPPSSAAGSKRIDSLLHFAVVGGGPTGVEFAAELHDLIHEDLCKLYPPALTSRVRITLFDVAPTVLPMFEQALSRYATELFHRSGIEMRTKTQLAGIRPVEEAEAGGSGLLRLSVKPGENGNGGEGVKKGEEVDVGLVVWSTGLAPNPLVEKLGQEEFSVPSAPSSSAGDAQHSKDAFRLLMDPKTGSVVTDDRLRARIVPVNAPAGDDHLRPTINPDVFVVGDCAVIEAASPPLPRTAQVASQQAVYLAKRLSRNDHSEAKPFHFRNLGMMAYLGNWKAIHQSSADELKGWVAWVLWRMAYLTRSMSIRNKIMVPVYWAVSWIFGRDISRF